MLSYHADADINTNPYELGLNRLINLDMEAAFVGKEALQRIRATGVSRKRVGLRIEGDPMAGPNTTFWPLSKAEHMVGHVTSAVHSPRLEQNIALGMVARGLRQDWHCAGRSDAVWDGISDGCRKTFL